MNCTDRTPRRQPAEESIDLYPGLVVFDGRVGGAITAGRSRIPLYVLIHESFGWDSIYVTWATVTEDYGYTMEDFAAFLRDLLSAPGELGRLLLLIAEAERGWRTQLLEPYLAQLRHEQGKPVDDPSVELDFGRYPRRWWEHESFRAPVLEQLRRVLAALEPGQQEGEL